MAPTTTTTHPTPRQLHTTPLLSQHNYTWTRSSSTPIPSLPRPTTVPDIENKVSVVPHDWATHPTTETSLHIDVAQSETDVESDDNEGVNINGGTKRRARKQRERSDRTDKAKHEVKTFRRHFADWVVHPGPGLIGGIMTFREPPHSNSICTYAHLTYTLHSQPRRSFWYRI